jgi:REP element-mobilizing transposase RayT
MKISGVYAKLFLHFVWSTKNRQPTLTDQIENAVKIIFRSKAKEMNLEIIEAEGAADHIHVLLRSNQHCRPSDIAKHFKGSSSHFVNNVIVPKDYDRFYWQDGYGVVSVSSEAVDSVASYVRNQKKRHQQKDIFEALEKTNE